jgi:hypothetical protein
MDAQTSAGLPGWLHHPATQFGQTSTSVLEKKMTDQDRTEWGVLHQQGIATGPGAATEQWARSKYDEMLNRWFKAKRPDVRKPILVTRVVTDWHPTRNTDKPEKKMLSAGMTVDLHIGRQFTPNKSLSEIEVPFREGGTVIGPNKYGTWDVTWPSGETYAYEMALLIPSA